MAIESSTFPHSLPETKKENCHAERNEVKPRHLVQRNTPRKKAARTIARPARSASPRCPLHVPTKANRRFQPTEPLTNRPNSRKDIADRQTTMPTSKMPSMCGMRDLGSPSDCFPFAVRLLPARRLPAVRLLPTAFQQHSRLVPD